MIFPDHLCCWLEDLRDALPLLFLAWILFGLPGLVDELAPELGPSELQDFSCSSLRFLDCGPVHRAYWLLVGLVAVVLDYCSRWVSAHRLDLSHLVLLRLLASCLDVELQNQRLHLRKLKWGGYHRHRLLLLLLLLVQ